MVVDVFMLDTATEMLESPVEFLSYLKLRAEHAGRIVAHDELTILSFYLQRNLLLDQSYDFFYMEDNISMELDTAMLVRRHGVAGSDVVEGFLSRLRSTTLGRILRSIERQRDTDTIELAFALLQLREDTVNEVSGRIDKLAEQAKVDGHNHDMSVLFRELNIGLTVHCNPNRINESAQLLIEHCKRRKYSQRVDNWFGICIANDGSLRYGVHLKGIWKYNATMERKVRELDSRIVRNRGHRRIVTGYGKVGRNDQCPCGSGKKYKHCCLL